MWDFQFPSKGHFNFQFWETVFGLSKVKLVFVLFYFGNKFFTFTFNTHINNIIHNRSFLVLLLLRLYNVSSGFISSTTNQYLLRQFCRVFHGFYRLRIIFLFTNYDIKDNNKNQKLGESTSKARTKSIELFTCVFGKLRASSDYYKRDWTRNLRTCCAKVLIEKNVWKKGHEMHSGYLESRTGFEAKGHCLSTGLRLQVKAR